MRQLEYTEQKKQKGLLPDMNKIILSVHVLWNFSGGRNKP